MRRAKYATSMATALVALALGGCGDPASSGTVKPPAKVTLSSPAIHGLELPAEFTCDGKNVSPPLAWGKLPANVEELAVFALEIPHGITSRLPTVVWSLAGVNPSLHQIGSDQVPSGAYLVETSSRARNYSVCPHRGQVTDYVFAIYALPAGIHATRAINGLDLYRNLTEATPQDRSPAVGGILTQYVRR